MRAPGSCSGRWTAGIVARPTAPGGALGEGHHRLTGAQPTRDGIDNPGKPPQAGSLDRNDLQNARHDPYSPSGEHVGARDERPGQHRTDAEDVQPGHVPADHQDSAQVPNWTTRHRDPDTEKAQHQPAIDALHPRSARQWHHHQRHSRYQEQSQHDAKRYPQHHQRPPHLRSVADTHAADAARCAGQPGVFGDCGSAHRASFTISEAAATDRSRRRYRVSAWSLSSSRQKSPTPKSGSCAGSPQARAPSLR